MVKKRTIAAVAVTAVAIRDATQRDHAIRRIFPIIGWGRYFGESVGPETRQYLISDNNSERPFSRDQRRWTYASSKQENNYFAFGTDDKYEQTPGYLILNPSGLLSPPPDIPADFLPATKVLGGFRNRRHSFRPQSAMIVSGMSYGSLSGPAVEALNKGAALDGYLHNTGEGGISPYHQHGGNLIYQIGTGYFGCRDENGNFSLERLVAACEKNPVKAIEIKLSQGAKPGLGGVLPGKKVTKEISEIRGVPAGQDCISPHYHSAFSTPSELLDFVELLAEATGLPVGIKSAVGDLTFWEELADLMAADPSRSVDFITIDGGEGGTGAAPLSFSDHVSLPFHIGFPRIKTVFDERGVSEQVVWIGSGKLGLPIEATFAFTMGCDMVAVGRTALFALGCIQAQRCHTGRCPSGVATQNWWLARGLDPTLKSVRAATYMSVLRREVNWLARTTGYVHPALIPLSRFEMLDGPNTSHLAHEVMGVPETFGQLNVETANVLEQFMLSNPASVEDSAPGSAQSPLS